MNQNRLLFIQIQNTTLEHAHKCKEDSDVVCKTINKKSEETNSRQKVTWS